jgi:hypothetical protein
MADNGKQSQHDRLNERRELRKTLPQGRATSIDQRARECEDPDTQSPDLERTEKVQENQGSGPDTG